MKTILKRAFCTVTAFSILSSTLAASAEGEAESHDMELAVNLDLEEEMPLTLDKNTDVFYFNANINPGDKLHTSVKVSNDAEKALSWTLSDVQNLLDDDEQAILLLDVLNVTVSIENEVFYEGTCKDLGGEVIPWRELQPGDSEIINIDWEFDKYADNTYQAANYREKWVFETQADIPNRDPDDSEPTETTRPPEDESIPDESIPELPPSDVETPTKQGENVQTGVEEKKDTNYAVYFVIGGIIIAGGYIAYEVYRRHKNK